MKKKMIIACFITSMTITIIFSGLLDVRVLHGASITTKYIQEEIHWQWTYGDTGNDYAFDLVQTADGGFVLAGYTHYKEDSEEYKEGNIADMLLVKTDAEGVEQWKKSFNLTDYDRFTSIIQAPDGGFVLTGYTDNGMLLIKTDGNGVEQWNRSYGRGGCAALEAALIGTADGGFALTGDICCCKKITLLKTDADGRESWNRTFTWETDGDFVSSLLQTSDGGFVLVGSTYLAGTSNLDMLLVKTDTEGTELWKKTYGGKDDDSARSLVLTADGGFILAGDTQRGGDADFWLVKTDADGNEEWRRTYGGDETDRAYALIETVDGGYALTGYTSFSNTATTDLWLVKTDKEGKMQWYRMYGGTGDDEGFALLQTVDGGFVLAGSTSSYETDNTDFWLLKTGNITGTDTTETVKPVYYKIAEIVQDNSAKPGIFDSPGFGVLPLLVAITILTGWYKWKKRSMLYTVCSDKK